GGHRGGAPPRRSHPPPADRRRDAAHDGVGGGGPHPGRPRRDEGAVHVRLHRGRARPPRPARGSGPPAPETLHRRPAPAPGSRLPGPLALFARRALPSTSMAARSAESRPVRIPADGAVLSGDLDLPPGARGVVAFAHGSGSSRHSPRNRRVAEGLRQAGLGTLLLDLLTTDEESEDALSGHLRFDIGL